MVAVMYGLNTSMSQSRDARRKTDLRSIAQALENYYNDHQGYPAYIKNPPAGQQCGTGTELKAYLKDVPCDESQSAFPYKYLPGGSSLTNSRGETVYRGYRLLTKLEHIPDPVVDQQGCSANGCGGVATEYNWGFAANVPLDQN